MAYGKRYTIQAVAKTEPTETVYTCEIWEKDYVSGLDAFDAAANPFTAQILASSDYQFDPILASTLTLLIDITNFTGVLPNFTTTDDRKYWVKLYSSGTTYYVWQGFMLMDSVSVHFSTGVLFLQCPCVDGLSILKDIPYAPSDNNVNVIEDLSTTITNCLNKIQLPGGYNIYYGFNVYAAGHVSSASMFKQSYLPPRNWLNSDPSTYMSCYEVLSIIMTSFGCQIYQSYGAWWVVSQNERGEDSVRFLQTTNANGPENVHVRWTQRQILPYADTTNTPFYFQDNIQTKILRKGFPNVMIYHIYRYASNFISDYLLKDPSTSTYWVMGYSGTGSNITVAQWVPAKTNAFTLVRGTAPAGFAQVKPIGLPNVSYNETITFSFDIFQSDLSGGVRAVIKLEINDGTGTNWYLDFNNQWSKHPGLQYYFVGAYTGASSSNSGEKISVTTPRIPAAGILTYTIRTDASTMSNLIIGNFFLTCTPYWYRQNVRNYDLLDTTIGYKKDIEFLIGEESPDDVNTSANGILLSSTGSLLFDWYVYGTPGITYASVMRLVYQRVYNIISKASINFDLTLRGLIDTRNAILPPKKVPHVIGTLDNVIVQDSTGTTLSVNGKYYVPGAMNINYTQDTISGTMLEVSDVLVSTTITDEIIIKPIL